MPVPVCPPPRNGKPHTSKRCRQCRYPRPAGTAQRRCRRPIPRRSRPGGDGPGSTGCGPAATVGRSSGHRSQIHASTTAIYPPEWAGARPVPGNSLRRQSSVASDRFRNPQRPFSLGAGTALHAPKPSFRARCAPGRYPRLIHLLGNLSAREVPLDEARERAGFGAGLSSGRKERP